MTKYYYTDSLMAAISARDFGVEFLTGRGRALIYDGKWHCPDDGIDSEYMGEKFTVHPDSYHIFEPQAGDIVITQCPRDVHRFQLGYWEDVSCHDLLGTPRIIQRNGKLFPWPEVEND